MKLWFWKKKRPRVETKESFVDDLSAEQRAELAANLRRILDPKNAEDRPVTTPSPETVTLS